MEQTSDRISLPELLAILASGRRTIARVAAVLVAGVAAVTLLLPRTFTASATFMPEGTETGMSELSAIAGQFGFSVPIGDAGSAPSFYVDLIRSEMMLRELVQLDLSDIPAAAERGVSDLVGWYDIERDNRQRAVEDAAIELREDLVVGLARETGVIQVEVSLHDPTVATTVVEGVIRLINEFNVERRQRQVSQERAFASDQLTLAQGELEEAENELRDFLQANRMFETSPELVFERDRLQRQVIRHEQIVVGLQRSFDQARIEEVRTTPVITVIQPPVAPAQPDRRRLLLKGIVAGLLGLASGVTVVAVQHVAARSMTRDHEQAGRLRVALADLTHDLVRPWRLLFGGKRGSSD